jgi:choline kinase
MRALILAAGRGSRTGVLGDERPKCLLQLAGNSLIERQIAALRRGGVSAIGVVRGYRAELIRLPNVTYFENRRWAESNMVVSLTAAADWLRSEPLLVGYADIFYTSELVRDLVAKEGDLVIAYDRGWQNLWCRRFIDPLTDAETFRTDEVGNLVEIGGRPKTLSEIAGQYIGLLKFTPNAWHAAEAALAELDDRVRDRLDMTGLLHRLLLRGFQIGTLGIDGQWGEVDTAEDLEIYERMIIDGELLLEKR